MWPFKTELPLLPQDTLGRLGSGPPQGFTCTHSYTCGQAHGPGPSRGSLVLGWNWHQVEKRGAQSQSRVCPGVHTEGQGLGLTRLTDLPTYKICRFMPVPLALSTVMDALLYRWVN